MAYGSFKYGTTPYAGESGGDNVVVVGAVAVITLDAPAGSVTIVPLTSFQPASQTTAPSTIKVSIFKPDGVTFICNVPRRRAVEWQDEINAPGSGKFEIHLDDAILAAHPDAVDYFNIVKFYLDGTPIKIWQIENCSKVFYDSGEEAARWVSVSGRGGLSLLEAAVVYPEYGFRSWVEVDRNFDYSSKDGEWRVPSEWSTPVASPWGPTATQRTNLPTGWPDPSAQWIWSSNPESNSAPGVNWFRAVINLAVDTAVVIYATADDFMAVNVDGETVLASQQGVGAFRTVFQTQKTLTAGEHTIGALVTNNPKLPISPSNPTGANPAGFLMSIFKTTTEGSATSVNILRTSASSFIVKPYGAAPGWYGASILKQLVTEAQTRNVASLRGITFGFNGTTDSDGVAWTGRQDRTVPISTDLWDVAQQIIELSMDLDISPDLVLNAWQERGSDKSATVRILPNVFVSSSSSTGNASKLKNRAIIRSEAGWIEIFNSGSEEDHGRREAGISAGNANSKDQMLLVGTAALREVSRPETTVPLSYTSVKGPRPYFDYELGDYITAPDYNGDLAKARVMSITGSEQEGFIQWSVDVYPDDPIDQIDSVVTATTTSTGTADPSTLYPSEVLSDSPWMYLRQLETSGTRLFDSSGNGRYMDLGAPTSGYTLGAAGPISKAVWWNAGNTSYARTPVRFAYQYATLEAWVYMAANPSGNTNLVGMSVDDTPGVVAANDKQLFINSAGKPGFYVYRDSGHTTTVLGPAGLALNTWHHVVGTVGTTGTRLYVNGSQVAANTAVVGSYVQGQYVFSRSGPSGYDTRAAIRIAEIAVYYQQLTASRVASHFAASTGLI